LKGEAFIAENEMKKMYIRKMVQLQTLLYEVVHNEDGMGMVEIALIIIVIITLGLTFKIRITEFLNEIFDSFAFTGLTS